ncbi:hypothetical protein [Jeotgalibaca porci]|uniref:hypothetical protein n=1 Tax=Jeotgalibaca porci TaxID=1868793 RepID=UPI00359FECD3
MPLIPKPNYNQIFASQAPEQDKPAVFNNYPEGWGPESRPNNGKPTIKGFNYVQQTSDLKDLWILQNGACLPYDESIEYAEGAPVLKDGVIQYKTADGFSPVFSEKPYILKYFTEGVLYPLNARVMLDNGDIVKSIINGNTNDPNADMMGWVDANIAAPMVIRDTASTSWAKISSTDVNDDKSALLAELLSSKKHVTIDTQIAINNPIETTIAKQRITSAAGGKLLIGSGMGQNYALHVKGDGSIIDGLVMDNPLQVKSATGDRQAAIVISAHDVAVRNNRLSNMLHGVLVTAFGEWFNTKIQDNYILDCLGVGGGASDLTGDQGEDRGDGIVTWGASAIITGNIVTCKEGQDARIGIHCEGLNTYVPTPSAQDGKNFIMANNIVKGHFRRHLVYENCYNAIMDSNVCWGGASWWNIALPEAYDTVVSNNVIYYDRTEADKSGQAWSPVRGVFGFLNGSDNISLNSNKILFSADAVGDIIVLQNSAIHKHRQISIYDMKPRSLKPASDLTEHGFLIYGDASSDVSLSHVNVKNAAYRSGFKGIYGARIDTIDIDNSKFNGVYEAVRTDNNAEVTISDTKFTSSTIKDNSTAGSKYTLKDCEMSIPDGFTTEPIYMWKPNTLDLINTKFVGGYTSRFLGFGTAPEKLYTIGNVGDDAQPTYTLAQLNDIAHAVNTYGKYVGKVVKTASNNYTATGTNPSDSWTPLSAITGSKVYDPPSIGASLSVSTTVGVTGVNIGDVVQVAFSVYNADIELTAAVSAVNTVTVKFKNTGAGAVDLASGTLTVKKL